MANTIEQILIDEYQVDPSKITPDAHLIRDIGLTRDELLTLAHRAGIELSVDRDILVRAAIAGMSIGEIRELLNNECLTEPLIGRELFNQVMDNDADLTEVPHTSVHGDTQPFTIGRVSAMVSKLAENARRAS